MVSLRDSDRDKLDAAVMRRLIAHLDSNKDVQNIDLMILAGFCRNCLSKWYMAAGDEYGVTISSEEAREYIYGMPYEQWKAQYQRPATSEQLAAMENRKKD